MRPGSTQERAKRMAVTPRRCTGAMSADRQIARIAKRKHGLVGSRQSGLDPRAERRLVEKGQLERPEPGVLRVAGAPTTWHQGLLARCMTEHGYASHRAAAALWRLEGF